MLLRVLAVIPVGIICFLCLCPGFSAHALEIKANAAGYVDAKACATCHQKHFSGFQHVGMSQSFGKINRQWFTPDKLKGLPFYHNASARFYDIQFIGEAVVFNRYQLDEDAEKVNEISVEIDYFLGSGNKAVAFLFRTENDELYHLPINWYANPGFWDMAPGYEQARHFGLSKKVLRECLFCHNAYPQEQMEQDLHWQRDSYPSELKNGIDCQRCHGPGKSHIETVFNSESTLESVRQSIVNPARLPPKKRDSVCLQCHLLPTVTMSGQRRFHRGDYSFRPGELLSDYLLHVDVVDENISKSDRFEINHHGYRLLQSECFKKSDSQLTCISCHNPHQKPEQPIFHEKVEKQCRQCHQDTEAQHSNVQSDEQSCVSCHMPQRRTQDVIHAVMTDHKIGIYQDSSTFLQPLVKQEPMIIDMDLFDKSLDLEQSERDVYRLVTLLQTLPTDEYVNSLKSRLIHLNYPHLRPYIVLVEAQLSLKRYRDALASLNFMKHKFGDNLRITELFAAVNVASGRYEEAEQGFKWLLGITSDKTDSDRADADHGDAGYGDLEGPGYDNADIYFNYGLLKYKQKDYKEAFLLFQQAGRFKANFAIAIMYKALTKEAMGEDQEATRLFIESLNMEPLLDRSYYHLINLFDKQDMKTEAKRYYRLAIKNVQDTKLIRQISREPEKRYLVAE